jgi:hypothetical protein
MTFQRNGTTQNSIIVSSSLLNYVLNIDKDVCRYTDLNEMFQLHYRQQYDADTCRSNPETLFFLTFVLNTIL